MALKESDRGSVLPCDCVYIRYDVDGARFSVIGWDWLCLY